MAFRDSILILLALGFAWHSTAFGNFVGNDTQNFNPIASGLDFVTVQSSQTLAEGFLNSGFFLSEAHNVLPNTIDPNGNWVASKDTLTFGDVSLGYGIWRDLEFDLNLSYLLQQQTNQDDPGAQFAGTGLNEIRTGLKYNLLQRSPIGAAFVLSTNMNQAANNPFSGLNSGPTINLEAAIDGRFGDTLLALNGGYRHREKGTAIPGSLYQPLPDEFIGSAAASRYLPWADLKLIGEIFAAKMSQSVEYVDASKIASEYLIGVKYDVLGSTSLQLGGGGRLTSGLFTPDWRVYFGLNVAFDVFHHAQASEPAANPSPSPAPNSAPGVPVAPLITNIYKGYQPQDIEALKDVPFDEVAQTHDFGLRKTVGNHVLEGDKPPFELVRLDDFDFDSRSWVIRPEYGPKLDRLAEYLKADPPVLKIRVEGHTDSIGSAEKNRRVSYNRADALKRELLKRGVSPSVEIEAVGYGSDRPIADNGNFQGRKQNRRVEIRILRKPSPQIETIQK